MNLIYVIKTTLPYRNFFHTIIIHDFLLDSSRPMLYDPYIPTS